VCKEEAGLADVLNFRLESDSKLGFDIRSDLFGELEDFLAGALTKRIDEYEGIFGRDGDMFVGLAFPASLLDEPAGEKLDVVVLNRKGGQLGVILENFGVVLLGNNRIFEVGAGIAHDFGVVKFLCPNISHCLTDTG